VVEIGSFPEGLHEENETELRNSVEFGGDECDGKANLLNLNNQIC